MPLQASSHLESCDVDSGTPLRLLDLALPDPDDDLPDLALDDLPLPEEDLPLSDQEWLDLAGP